MAVIVYAVVFLLFSPGLPEEDQALGVLDYNFVGGVADGGEPVREGWPGGKNVGGVRPEGYYVSEGFDGGVGF